MKNRIVTILSILTLCFIMGGMISEKIVKADIIWTPESHFYEANHNKYQIYMVRREFKVASPTGKVIAFADPLSIKAMETYVNGDVLQIFYVCTLRDGTEWGMISTGEEKWVPMKYLKVIYDNISFNEEHKKDFKKYDNRLDEDFEKKDVYFWQYPNSSKCTAVVNVAPCELYVLDMYYDEESRAWGYVGYYHCCSGWILLDDLSNKTPYSFIHLKSPKPTGPVVTLPSTTKPVPTTPVPTVIPVTPVPTPTVEPTIPVVTKMDYNKDIAVKFKYVDCWGENLHGAFEITNRTPDNHKGFSFEFDYKNKITSLWTSELVSQKEEKVVVKNADWDNTFKAGETKVIEFIAEGSKDCEPSNYNLKFK